MQLAVILTVCYHFADEVFERKFVRRNLIALGLRASLMMSDGNLAEILTRPYAILFLALAVFTVAWPSIAKRLSDRKSTAKDTK